jgi:NADH-quinone oxidoreductase subunit E
LEKLQREQLDHLFSSFKGSQDELISIMEEAQTLFGYLSSEVLTAIAGFLKLPEGKVYGVATFYALFRLKPSGKKIVRVCRGTACHVRQGSQILQEVQKHLGIKPGETTADMEYSLETVSCFGSCAMSPVLVINNKVFGRMTASRVAQIIGNRCKSEKGTT